MHERIPLGIIGSAVYGLRDGAADLQGRASSVYKPASSDTRLSVALSKWVLKKERLFADTIKVFLKLLGNHIIYRYIDSRDLKYLNLFGLELPYYCGAARQDGFVIIAVPGVQPRFSDPLPEITQRVPVV